MTECFNNFILTFLLNAIFTLIVATSRLDGKTFCVYLHSNIERMNQPI